MNQRNTTNLEAYIYIDKIILISIKIDVDIQRGKLPVQTVGLHYVIWPFLNTYRIYTNSQWGRWRFN